MRICILFCLIRGELDLVRVEFEGDAFKVFLDERFVARGRDAEDLEGVVD
jgi:hypothetical protein